MITKLLSVAVLSLLAAHVAAHVNEPGQEIAEAAKAQIGVTLRYDSRYQKIGYPGGDLPMDRGVCTDVVIRAYRKFGVDLQVLVHQDMSSAWSEYPNSWHAKSTDTNIDHRRVPNLAVFFARHGKSLSIEKNAAIYLPGDLVTWRLRSGVPHIGVVASEKSRNGVPLVVHNIGWGTMLEDRLFDFTITGHFRYIPSGLTTRPTGPNRAAVGPVTSDR
jgi:hypothetical protein